MTQALGSGSLSNGQRFVSITFDDGLINGARRAIEVLNESDAKATFYIVTGWIRPRLVPWIREKWNRGQDHGSWRDWIDIVKLGHDVGSHTVTHLNASGRIARNLPGVLRWELRHSYEQLRRHLPKPPTSIAMPWNAPADAAEDELRSLYPACRLGSSSWQTNDLAQLDRHRLNSWAPDSNVPAEEIVERVRNTPEGHWSILQFHSLDGEGYMPITTKALREVVRGIKATANVELASVDEIICRLGIGADNDPASSRKNVCIVTSEHLSANPRVVKEADALSEAGYDVRVIACQWMDWARKEDAKLLAKRRWRARLIDYSRKFAPTLFWWSRIRHNLAQRIWPWISTPRIILSAAGRVAPELVRVAAKEKADLFIGHNLAGLPVAVIAAKRHHTRAGFDAEDLHSKMWLHETGPATVDRLAERIEQRFIPGCDFLTAASPLILKSYADRYRTKVTGTILNVFPRSDQPQKFRAHDPVAPLTLYWFSQVIGAHRGLEEIITAMGRFGSTSVQLHLRGRWQPGYETNLRALVREVGLQPDQLIWHPIGPPEEIVHLAAEYDVGLALEQPISENRDICLTNKIFVYLLAGNAIIGTATRAQKPLIENLNGAGVSYVAGNVEELAGYLRRLEQDRDALEQARRKAWQFGSEYYNWDIEKEKLLDTVGKSLHASALAK